MGKGKYAVSLAAFLTLNSMALAQVATSSPSESPNQVQTATPTTAASPPATPEKPLMMGLDAIGVGKALEDANINIYGYVEGSYEYNFMKPAGHANVGRAFDTQSDNNPVLNQVDLSFERTVDYTKDKWDVGGKVEVIYGSDSRFIHSNGLDFYGPNDAADGGEQTDPSMQFDLNQAYVDVAVPLGSGLRLRAGKFDTIMGYESINPTVNPLFSHSYLFTWAIPLTQTGVLATYNITPAWTITAGFTRGWEQALKDNNGDAIDFLGGVTWTVNSKLTLTLNNSTGPETAGDTNDYRTVFDFIGTYAATSQLTFALNADYGFQQNGADGGAGGPANWYGVAGYAGYAVNSYVTVNVRGEYFNDQDNARGLSTIPLKGTDVYEGTFGLTITPMPNNTIGSNLKIRPEVRYDYAQRPIFEGGTNNSQCTAAIEAYFTY
jgi:Putative beta-barrel porin-2, OmpL-like. bbp2